MDLHASTYLDAFARVLASMQATTASGGQMPLDGACAQAVAMLMDRRHTGHRVFIVGNGGSSAIAGHLHVDLCNAVKVRAQVFDQAPITTALANDCGYPTVFERPLELFAEPGDLLIAISSSGQSENILRAARMAASKGTEVITLSGFKPDNPLRSLGHINFYVPSTSYGQVELAHQVLGHFFTDAALAWLADAETAAHAPVSGWVSHH